MANKRVVIEKIMIVQHRISYYRSRLMYDFWSSYGKCVPVAYFSILVEKPWSSQSHAKLIKKLIQLLNNLYRWSW